VVKPHKLTALGVDYALRLQGAFIFLSLPTPAACLVPNQSRRSTPPPPGHTHNAPPPLPPPCTSQTPDARCVAASEYSTSANLPIPLLGSQLTSAGAGSEGGGCGVC
jgi:hypothetical protein